MSIEDSINTLAHTIGRLADAIAAQGRTPQAAPAPITVPVETVKPKAETVKKPVEPAAATPAPAAKEAPTYDSTRALMLQVVEKFGRDEAVAILGSCGLQDLKKGTVEHFVKVTAAALARLA